MPGEHSPLAPSHLADIQVKTRDLEKVLLAASLHPFPLLLNHLPSSTPALVVQDKKRMRN
jgi:hypothetical protein